MPEPEVRDRLGRYTLMDKLGEGGMGVVFRSQIDGAEGFTKAVAIKTIHEAYARDPGIREMFTAEAKTAQRLQHGNIVQIIDVGLDEDTPFLVIELIDGASLAAVMSARRHTALPIADALYIAESVASALAYAHGLTDNAGRHDGVVHRDVTPRNILISRDGVVKLADFGIAKALSAPSYTLPGTFKGSIGYLAPEQAQGKTIDARADQFAFGVVLHEMLSGKNPLLAKDIEQYGALLDAGVPKLEGDAELAAIVARATSIDPSARYPSMDDLRADLEAWRVAHKIRTSNDSVRETMRLLLAQDATKPTNRALGDLLGSGLRSVDKTKQQSPRALAIPAKRHWRVLIVAMMSILAIVLVVMIAVKMGTKKQIAVAADAMALDAQMIDAASIDTQMIDAASIDAPVIDAPLVRPPKGKGLVKIMTSPWSSITIDGKSYGGVPVNVELLEGPHEVTFEDANGAKTKKQIRVKANETLEVTW